MVNHLISEIFNMAYYEYGIHLGQTLCLLCRQQAKPGCLMLGMFWCYNLTPPA